MTIYGVDEADPEKFKHPFADLADAPEEWRGIFRQVASVHQDISCRT
jgi:hypothetical protein